MTATIDWRARMLERLASTQPRHDPMHTRVAGVTAKYAARVLQITPEAKVPAAVLVPVIDRQPEATMLLTVRATSMRAHAGQIAFPGGRVEPGDSGPAAAALREAWEEIGLPPGQSRVLGYLPDHLVFTGFQVTPVVALVRPGFTLAFDSTEVADAFEVPLSHLFDPLNHGTRPSARQQDVEVYDIPFGERSIWGATAGILINLYQILCTSDPPS